MANPREAQQHHPDAFHVSGPRNLTSLNWRDLIISSWKDAKYKRTVIACFIQAVYLLELDRHEKRTQDNALAPNWWIPFKYKLTKTLIDERDKSIFGAILEWDQSAAMADLVLIRPSGAPRAVLVLRGTLLKSPTMRRDIEDDLRFVAWESLKGSVRFKVALEALKSICDAYGSSNVYIAGHSLGAGFALQIGKELAKQGIFVEAHLFNPPSVSLAMSLKNIGEKAEYVWSRVRSMIPYGKEAQVNNDAEKTTVAGSKTWMSRLSGSGLKDAGVVSTVKWIPHLYVNNSDYICCYYNDPNGTAEKVVDKDNVSGQVAAKLFVVSKEKQKFLEAHGLEQWWSSDAELQQVIHNSKLISRQLSSLYTSTPSQVVTRVMQVL
ncbi:hypothetical protein P8452_44691 [Trifolium repens]|nr:GDSL esterase/lipase [Trifolium repens]WJX59358.1 hypothetical protein P8452_44691 [Trifolium repens]